MLNIIIGRAGIGKTAHIMNDIKTKMSSGETDLLLIVPDQYSHDAEKQLCEYCGDRLSLHGEVLSFSRLCRNVLTETGRASTTTLDSGGQILVLYRAIESVAALLKVYNLRNLRTELPESLCNSIKEFKTFGIIPEMLQKIAEQSSAPLNDKLHDLSLIYNAYESILYTLAPDGDTTDKMSLLAQVISDSEVGDKGHIYFDGFNDFTVQEMNIIEQLMRKKANMTVCLTFDEHDSGEMFELPRRTIEKLKSLGKSCGIDIVLEKLDENSCEAYDTNKKADELLFLEKHLFEHGLSQFNGDNDSILLYAAPSRYAECEYAAAKIWELVRSGYRWREIGVMARSWDKYASLCENVFEKYDIPYFTGGRTEILNKSPIALIDSALDIASFGFEYKSVFKYLKTGLADISIDECALVENYVYKWSIRGTLWYKDWVLPPGGYSDTSRSKSDVESELKKLNELRLKITKPLVNLRDGIKNDTPIIEKLYAVYRFIDEINLPANLVKKADEFEKRFDSRLADEYAQTWNIIKTAMEQMYFIFSESNENDAANEQDAKDGTDYNCNAIEFKKLFMLVLSRYDIGAIPTSLDRTTLGGIEMNRRRDLKCLILLGATDSDLPNLSVSGGILSDNERIELVKFGIDIPAGFEERLCREMNMIYSTLTLPTQKLILSRPTDDGEHPSLFIKRIKSMFGLDEITLNEEDYMTAAKVPCFELASYSEHTNFSIAAAAARLYYEQISDEAADKLLKLDSYIKSGRGNLSASGAKILYGNNPSLSASRVDKYYSCPYLYFMHSGLKLKENKIAGLDASAIGLFMHYILENVFREIKETTGIKNADKAECLNIITRYAKKYTDEILLGFAGKNERFIYLFNRMEDNAKRIVIDMLDELKVSDFEPLDFELDISSLEKAIAKQDFNSPQLDGLSLKGIVDRVDGWINDDGSLYLRVVDYKTGKKNLKLSNILHGRDMQMFIYLLVLEKLGKMRYDKDIVPAGVMYIPARDNILSIPRNTSDMEIEDKHSKAVRRNGLMLNDLKVIEAMENSEIKKFLPISYQKTGMKLSDNFINQFQINLLSKHVDNMLKRAVKEISNGNIKCAPYFRSMNDNACEYCEYRAVCAFDTEQGDIPRYIQSIKSKDVWGMFERNDH